MTHPLYDIYFTGQLVAGIEQSAAQRNLAQLFKTDAASIARLFNGKAQLLKRGVDKHEALKYKAALHKAGLLVAFKTQQVQNTTKQLNATQNATGAGSTLSLAPAGSDVLNDDEKQVFETREIDTHHLKLACAFAEPLAQTQEKPPAPDTSHISVAAAGGDLFAERPAPPPPPELNLDAISIAPAGADLEQLQDATPPVLPDISGISLAPVGSDIMPGPRHKKQPPAPDTDHISLVQD